VKALNVDPPAFADGADAERQRQEPDRITKRQNAAEFVQRFLVLEEVSVKCARGAGDEVVGGRGTRGNALDPGMLGSVLAALLMASLAVSLIPGLAGGSDCAHAGAAQRIGRNLGWVSVSGAIASQRLTENFNRFHRFSTLA
jgi:hypothetical protein